MLLSMTLNDLDRQDRRVTVFVCARTMPRASKFGMYSNTCVRGACFVSHAPHLKYNPQVPDIWDLPYVYDVHAV